MFQNLEEQVIGHEKYKQSYQKTMDWIRNARLTIQQCSDLHVGYDTIIDKDAKIKDLINSLNECDTLVNNTIELSISVMKTTGSEGNDTIKQEIEQLNHDWEGLEVICKETQKSIGKCINAWNNYTTNYDKMKKYIEEHQGLVNKESEGENKTPDDLARCKKLLDKIVCQKPQMEQLNDYCEILTEQSACIGIRDQTVQLQGIYTNLLTAAQGLVSKIEKNLSDHTEFLKAKENLQNWLFTAHGTVQDCIGMGDEKYIKDKLETIRLVSTRMTEGQHLLSILQESFTKAINTAPSEKQDNLREDMTTLRNSWDQLNMDITSVQAQLKASLTRWEDYNDSKNRIESWLNDMEQTLKDSPNTKGEIGEMKTLLERYKNLQLEIVNKQSDLNRLQSEAAELGSWAKQPSVVDNVKKLQVRYQKVADACKILKEQLESEIQDYNVYHQSLQDTEKWLLQVSFHLMAHNSLYITNREQTEAQISQHEILLVDIQKYQKILDDLKAKGHGQIERYVKTSPGIKDTIEKQLSNVQDSYNSLLHTAVQIKNRLLDSLAKFKEYEDTLESIMQNLDSYEPVINEIIDKPVSNLSDSQQQLENARVSRKCITCSKEKN